MDNMHFYASYVDLMEKILDEKDEKEENTEFAYSGKCTSSTAEDNRDTRDHTAELPLDDPEARIVVNGE